MNVKKQYLIALAFCCITAVGGIGFLFYQNEREIAQKLENEQSNQRDLQLAKQKLREWQPFYALSLVKKHLDEIYNASPYAQEWLNISLKAGAKLQDSQFLVNLFNWEKSLFLHHEDAAIVVAEQLIDQERNAEFHYLKNHWQKDTELTEKWALLDADYHARNGDGRKAITLLAAKKFKDPYEVDRLLRLAFLNLNEHPKISWEYLSEACKLDPANPDLRIYRAHFLNSMGKTELAAEELDRSLSQHETNDLLKEELIEQHVRNKNFTLAVTLLDESLAKDSSESTWLKALFLNKVVAPVKVDRNFLSDSKMNPEIAYFLHLKEGSYFDESAAYDYLAKAEISWMELIHLLKQGKEEKAYRFAIEEKMLDHYHPELKIALIRVLAERNPSISSLAMPASRSKIGLFDQLGKPPYSKELRQFLASDEALSALFLAAGWNEAALQLRTRIEHPQYDLPEWYTIGITEALAQNHNIEKAITFAKQQKPSDTLALLLGELYVKTNHPEQAIAIFKKLATQDNAVGERATFLLANEYLDQGNLGLAKRVLTAHDAWKTPEGQLILARLYLRLGDKVNAESLFARIADTSSEAKSYLASKAFYEKDYQLAYHLTKDLYRQNPHNKELKQNLKKISQAAKQKH